ncbi:MAG: SDR family oxidoreductase [Bacteroidota bacterium]
MDKLAVVTGGTKGIGRAVTAMFASQGYAVATCARSEEDLAQLKTELEAEGDSKIHTFAADLSKRKDIDDFLDFVTMTGKRLEILVNNTGVFIPGEVQTEDDGVLQQLLETNLMSAYHVTRGLLTQLKKNDKGHIFNVCSTASLEAYPNGGSYSISKFALYGFSQVLRHELRAEGIRVTAVIPGPTFTPSWDGVEIDEDRLMKAADIAQMIWATSQLSEASVVEDIIMRPQLGDL